MQFLNEKRRFPLKVYGLLAIIIGSLSLFGYWAADRQLPIMAQSGKFVGWDENNPRIGHQLQVDCKQRGHRVTSDPCDLQRRLQQSQKRNV